ncbi:MAG: MFS transporter [Deltaproteobacteria bacterium]|nr:MFS transporter [Deltaproteobacteria bacterium]RLA89822.1 MAG: MFS transporter [Deltaproteobacteria bacterium]
MRKLSVFSWAFYDFANTIFSMNIVSLYFALWVVKDLSGKDIYYSFSLSASMLAVAISMPFVGALSDNIGKRMPFLFVYTITCVTLTAILGLVNHLLFALIFFGFAHYFYQGALVFYNALLPEVSSPENQGTISGIGVSLGYLGAILGMVLVMPFVSGKIFNLTIPFIKGGGNKAAFIPTAFFFFIFSLPTFLFIKEKKGISKSIENSVVKKVIRIFSKRKEYKPILRYMIARFFYVDAINTVITFMSIYLVKVIGFSEKGDVQFFLIISTIFAIIGSFLFGILADKIGYKKALLLDISLFILTVIIAATSFNKKIFFLVGPLSGISLGGVWTCDRPLLVNLSPPDMLGEFFGLYSLSGKLAAVVGPLLWGFIVFLFEDFGIIRYRIAIGSLFILFATGFLILLKVPEKRIENK